MKKGSSESEIECNVCQAVLNIAAAGKSEIEKHLKTQKHIGKLNARASSQKVTSFFSSTKDFTVTACEGVWAYHTVQANHSFNSSECASRIFRTCFQVKMFHCGRTKCEAIVTNVFSPFAVNEIKNEMENVKFVNIATDASNHGNVKMMPVLVRYFLPTVGVRVRVLDFSFEKGETSLIIFNLLKRAADEFKIKEKVVGFCADNCATNFGSDERGGENNVYFHLKQWKPNLIGIGCAAHVVHNALKHACDSLPVDIECIVVKIFSFFYIYTTRVEALKSMCDDMEIQYHQLLGYTKTRFLAMGPAIGRILKIFDALKTYFLGLPKGHVTIKNFFRDPLSKMWLLFAKEQVSVVTYHK